MNELYKNIKKYRMQMNLSQEKLAFLTGYKDKSMISKIEKGLVDLPLSKILIIAKIFNVSPSELIGKE